MTGKKPIKLSLHALNRFNERFHFNYSDKQILELIASKRKLINQASLQKEVKVGFNIEGIPCIAVIYKSLAKIYIITIYINEKKEAGQYYVKRRKELAEEREERFTTPNAIHKRLLKEIKEKNGHTSGSDQELN